MTFPTGKPHVSFSEVKVWKECSYRHKLAYVDKLDSYEANPYADYGTTFAKEWHQVFFHDPEGNVIEVHQKVD